MRITDKANKRICIIFFFFFERFIIVIRLLNPFVTKTKNFIFFVNKIRIFFSNRQRYSRVSSSSSSSCCVMFVFLSFSKWEFFILFHFNSIWLCLIVVCTVLYILIYISNGSNRTNQPNGKICNIQKELFSCHFNYDILLLFQKLRHHFTICLYENDIIYENWICVNM